MKEHKLNRKEQTRVILIALVILLAIGAALVAVRLIEKHDQAIEAQMIAEVDERYGEEALTVRYQGTWYTLRDDLETYLIIGLDKFEDTLSDPNSYINNQQADLLLLLIVDKEAQSYTALQVNRDSMGEIHRLGLAGADAGTFTGQLALAHTYGSGGKDSDRNTALAVSNYLYGVPVNHYVSVTMDAVQTLNDMVGGVTVLVEDDFSAIDPTLVKGQEVTLLGEHALTFVRGRNMVGDSTNINRMQRQREYIRELYKKIKSYMQADDDFAFRAIMAITDYLVSDCTAAQLSDLANMLEEFPYPEILTIEGEAVKGEQFMEFYADEDALQAQVIDLFFEVAQDVED